ncbi:unnamed protein product [Mucor hiemalis]
MTTETEKKLSAADANLQKPTQGHFSMVRNFYLADVITLMNGVCGVQSVLSSMRYLTTNNVTDLHTSMILMPLGMLFDFMDGRVARWRNNSSLLGQELDSLADLISFGLAPSALAYAVGMRTYLDTIALTYFVCCGIARLARYNATVALAPKDATGKVNHFEGTPIPTSLSLVGVIAYLVLNGQYLDNLPGNTYHLVAEGSGWDIHPFVFLYVISGTLMISKTLRIPKP